MVSEAKEPFMDDVQKSKIRMTHWIDHNVDHMGGYKEVADILEKNGYATAAEKIRRGVAWIEKANDEFESAMIDLSSVDEPAHEHGRAARHEHSHEKRHEHHDRSHSHKDK
jgi:hypothetical protein